MYTFFFEIGFFAGLGTMIYLVARAIPRVGDDLEPHPHEPGVLDRFLARIPMEKMDALSSRLLEKALRRARLLILRLDNVVGRSLEKIKRTNGNGHDSNKATLFSAREEKEQVPKEGEN